ncbi:MAG: AAA family ATPase [Spiroplasma ixodetis]|nr:AAA family ATPase [Spiroplasma ixodetis]MBP1527314.1 AAA family ATPase [Spiroplasma ixodetis]MBP1528587.1 AAA family ATPase [Spiroplasma ixodetis]
MSKVFSFINNKGGVLKTTLTINCASALAIKGYKVLIIDMDAQGNVGSSFGQNVEALKYTIYDVIFNDINFKKVLLNLSIKNDLGGEIDILPSNSNMIFFEKTIIKKFLNQKNEIFMYKNLVNLIENLKDDYDYIFIDSPPSTSIVMDNILFVVDNIYIPIQPEAYSYQGFNRLLLYINQFKQDYGLKPLIKAIIPTMVNQRTNLHKIMIEQLKKETKKENIIITKTNIPISIKQAETITFFNLPLILNNPKNIHSKIYFDLCKELNLLKLRKDGE